MVYLYYFNSIILEDDKIPQQILEKDEVVKKAIPTKTTRHRKQPIKEKKNITNIYVTDVKKAEEKPVQQTKVIETKTIIQPAIFNGYPHLDNFLSFPIVPVVATCPFCRNYGITVVDFEDIRSCNWCFFFGGLFFPVLWCFCINKHQVPYIYLFFNIFCKLEFIIVVYVEEKLEEGNISNLS